MKNFFGKVLASRDFCMVTWGIGLTYITLYGFLANPFINTASMIGLLHPVLFVFWGIISCVALASNINYMYQRFDVKSKAGYILMILGSLFIMTTVWIPSTKEMGLQLIAHWGTALGFAVCYAVSIGIFLAKMKDKEPKCKTCLIAFVVLLAITVLVLVILIITLKENGKNGMLESVPLWAAYGILYIANYTNIFKGAVK